MMCSPLPVECDATLLREICAVWRLGDHRGLWSIQELGRDRKDHLATEDAVNRLLRAGLVNRQGEFVFPTRAASHYRQIAR